MKPSFTWAKVLFSSTYKIYKNGKPVGYLTKRSFSTTHEAQIFDIKYLFIQKGFFNEKTSIIDKEQKKVIGKIEYNNWRNKAKITTNSEKLLWKFENTWNTKWSLTDEHGEQIFYSGSSMSGRLDTQTENPLYLLSGLYVANYHWKTAAVIVAVMIPIWITIFS